jgi:hypothetical protein
MRVAGISETLMERLIPVFHRVLTRKEAKRQSQAPADWERYVGRYTIPGIMDVDIVLFEGNLAVCMPAGTHEIRNEMKASRR